MQTCVRCALHDNKFLKHLVAHYNNKFRVWGQPLLKTRVTTSDNCAALAIYLAEYHGKGPADSAAGGAKTKADEAAVYGTTIETAYDLFNFLNAHYKQVLFALCFIENIEPYQMGSSPNVLFSYLFLIHRLLKRTMKPCMKSTLANSITSKRELFPPFFVETLLLFHLSSKIIALVLVILVFLIVPLCLLSYRWVYQYFMC